MLSVLVVYAFHVSGNLSAYVYARVYVCVHVCMFVCMYICTLVQRCISAGMNVFTWILYARLYCLFAPICIKVKYCFRILEYIQEFCVMCACILCNVYTNFA